MTPEEKEILRTLVERELKRVQKEEKTTNQQARMLAGEIKYEEALKSILKKL
ncbi:MAG: hypothetical protein R6V53_05625 [Candidatus Woesearchaeota archaeon]